MEDIIFGLLFAAALAWQAARQIWKFYERKKCTLEIPAEFVRMIGCAGRPSAFLAFLYPLFRYTYDGKEYKNTSLNSLFFLYVKKDELPQKTGLVEDRKYMIFLDPDHPKYFIYK